MVFHATSKGRLPSFYIVLLKLQTEKWRDGEVLSGRRDKGRQVIKGDAYYMEKESCRGLMEDMILETPGRGCLFCGQGREPAWGTG